MVILKDLFTLLATGEFSNIALSKNGANSIHETEYGKIIGHINLGLVEIYKRFKLLEHELTLHVTPDLSLYYLQDARLVTSTPNTAKYIEFMSGQTSVNIIEITGAFDDEGNELVLNNRWSTPSIIQQSTDILKVNKLTAAAAYSIVYQAYPIKIILDDGFQPEDYVLPISDVVLEALMNYIASRVYRPIGANNSTANADKSASYQQQYELSCQKLEILGLGIQNGDKEDTFTSKGWA